MGRGRIRGARRALAASVLCSTLLGLSPSSALAQRSAEELADAALAYERAEAAASSGDYQGAIAALERVLLIDPSLGNIKHKLALLYLRVGATRRAEYYLRGALEDPTMPPDVRSSALVELERLENVPDREDGPASRHSVSGAVGLALGFDTNPGSQSRLLLIQDTTREENVRNETNSASLRPSSRLDHALRLGTRRDAYWTNGVRASGVFYEGLEDDTGQDVSELSTVGLALRTGFDVLVGGGAGAERTGEVRLRPSVSAGTSLRDGEGYLDRFGIGLAAERRTAKLTSTFGLEVEHYAFGRDVDRDRDGVRLTAAVDFDVRLTPRNGLLVGLNVLRADAEAEFERHTEGGVDIGLTRLLHATPTLRWLGTLSAFGSKRVHDEGDFVVSERIEREENLLGVALATDLSFRSGLGLRFSASYFDNDSNLENYRYDNAGASAGISWRF